MKSQNSNVSGVGVASIAVNTMYREGSRWVNTAVRFVYVIALTHYLGPELYGLINYGMSWYLAFLPLTFLGMGAILGTEIGRDRNSGSRIASLTFTLRIFSSVIAAVACGILGWLCESKPEVRILLGAFSVGLVGRSLATWAGSIFNAYELNKYNFRLQAIFRTSEVVIGTALLLAGGGATAVAIVHAISWWLEALSGLAYIRLRLVGIRFNWSWHGLKHILVNGIPIGLASIMVTWLYRGPLVLFRHFGSSENSLGQLALAIQPFVILGLMPMSAVMASLPVLSRSVARQDGKEFLYTGTAVRAALILGAAVGLAGLGAGEWIVNLVFGIRYLEAGYLLGFVLWLLIPFTCGTAINAVYIARGRFFLPMVCSGVGALVMTLIMPWLVAAINTSGAVVAMATGMGVWASILIFLFARSGDLDVRQTIFRPLCPIFFALGVFLAMKSVNTWVALLTSWAALLFGTLQFGGVTEDEMYLLNSLKRKGYSLIGADSKRSGS